MKDQALYDASSPKDIERFGKRLVKSTLRKTRGAKAIPNRILEVTQGARTRGSFGKILEEYYYGITPPNTSEPDFSKAGVELKSTPLKRSSKGGFSAKERLVLNIINYHEEAKKDFMSSSFYHKNNKMMVVSYVHDDHSSVVDMPVRVADIIDFEELPVVDREIIKKDWESIVSKIREGKADQISEGDTFYLGACTKGATSADRRSAPGGIMAKPRAFSLKQSYMNGLLGKLIDATPIIDDLSALRRSSPDVLIRSKVLPYVGMTIDEIYKSIGNGLNKKSKDICARLVVRMFGAKGKYVEELVKAGIKIKTIRVDEKGNPQEDMSFPAFKYMEVIHEKWDADPEEGGAGLRNELEKKYLWAIYQEDDDGKTRFKDVMFWNMSAIDIDDHPRKVWSEAVKRIKKGQATDLPGKSWDPVCHVRPHGRNSKDVIDTPHNGKLTKKCFWLDRKYIREEIRRVGIL